MIFLHLKSQCQINQIRPKRLYPYIHKSHVALLSFLLLILTTLQSFGAVIYSIDFQNGAPGWTTGNLSTTSLGFPSRSSSWILTATTGGTASRNLGSTAYGTTNIGYQGAENSYIQSPAFTIQAAQVSLMFDSYTSNEAGFSLDRDVEWVEYSTDGGQTWQAMHARVPNLNDVAQDTTWRTFNFNANVTPGTAITFRFRFDTGDGCCGPRDISGWFIDNVIVSTGIVFTTQVTHNLCFGDSSGIIDITASGGTAPYQYSIDNGQTYTSNHIFQNLRTGNYQIVVKDATGDSSLTKAVKIVSPRTIQINPVQLSASCNGSNSGIGKINVKGGKSPFQYSLDNGLTWHTTATIDSLAPGNYTVLVKDKNNCFSTPDTLTISQSSANITFTTNTLDAGCNGGGSITVSASGGSAPYKYSKDGGTTFITDSIFDNLTAGTYPIQVQDSSGCIGTVSNVVINQLGTVVTFSDSSTTATCNLSNGKIIFQQATGGTAPYLYSIDKGVTFHTNSVFDTLASGRYYLQVKDVNGCKSIQKRVTIGNQVSSLNFSVNQQNPACGLQNGAITIAPSGGIPPYVCSIDSGATYHTTSTFNNLSSGTYTVIVKDSLGCEGVARNVIFAPNGSSVTFTASSTDASCGTVNNGSIDIHPTSGVAPFEFSVDSGATFLPDSTFRNLAPGTYQVQIKDNSTCYSPVQTIQINRTPAAFSFQVSTSPAACGNNNGTINIQASGNPGTWQYSADSGATFQSTSTFTNLSPGIYQVCIKNANNCISAVQPATITQSGTAVSFSTNITGSSCGKPGRIVILASNGTAPYQFSIDSGSTYVNTSTISNLTAGSYYVTVKDNLGCEAPVQLVTVPLISTAITFNTQITDEVCGNPGSIAFTASGGLPPYQFSIDNGTTYSTGNTFHNLNSGTYKLLVQDSLGCRSGVKTVTINQINSPTFTLNAVQDSCNSYQVTVHASNGTKPYQFSVDNGLSFQSDSIFKQVPGGLYTILVKDASGCQVNKDLTLLNNNQLSASAGPDRYLIKGSDTTCVTLQATVTNGKPPYSYTWTSASQPNLAFTDTVSVCPENTETFFLQVVDAKGCSTTDTVTVFIKDINNRAPSVQEPGFIAYPNPFYTASTLQYRFDKTCKYKLELYDMQGRFIKQLLSDTGQPGVKYSLSIHGNNFPEGCFMAVLKDGDKVRYLKLVVRK